MDIKSVKIKDGFILRELGGEFCIFHEADSENGFLVGLPSVNETCVFLWDRLEKGIDVEKMIQAVADLHGMDMEDAEYEVGEFLAKLIHGEVVVIHK